MKIFSCLKEVPSRETRYDITEDRSWIREADLTWEINECDEYCLEEALRIQEKHGAEVVVVTVGLERSEKSMRKALAMGADRGVLVVDEQRNAKSPATAAAYLREVISGEDFDLVLTGTQSDDAGYAQTGVMLAELLDVPHATIVMQIEVDPDSGTVRALREMESGWFQWVELPMPAVLTVQAGSSQVRYPSLKGIMQARKKEIRKVSAADLSLDPESLPRVEVVSLSVPQSSSRVEMLEGDVETVVSTLVEKLRKEAKVL